MSDEVENQENDTPALEPKKTAQDHYAAFIGKQAKTNSLFDTRGIKPVTPDDVARVTGKK